MYANIEASIDKVIARSIKIANILCPLLVFFFLLIISPHTIYIIIIYFSKKWNNLITIKYNLPG